MMFDCLGYSPDHPAYRTAELALRKLLVIDPGRSYCQPCLSPVWDTALTCHALMEAGDPHLDPAIERALEWLAGKQVLEVVGDWAAVRPGLRPGGWAFQYENPYYPDVDDTAVAALALDRFDRERWRPAIDRAAEWIVGMQSRNGGWGSFDADNTHYYLNHIPFADHGALLDPPTVDVSARCLGMLAQLGDGADDAAVAAALAYLKREQEARRQLVRPLGNQLHLWDLVSTGRPQRGRGRSCFARNAPRRGLALRPPTSGWRLG